MTLPAVLTERTLTFSQAAAECPAVGGRQPSAKTVYAWADLGIRVGDTRVKLECAKVGGRRVTSAEALARFLAATAGPAPAVVIETPTERSKRADAARTRVLRRLGRI